MKHLSIILLILTLLLPMRGEADFQKALTTLLKSKGIDTKKTGVYAVWTETGEPIVGHNIDLPLNPGSTVKLFTSYCSLKMLGSNHRFETEYYSDIAPQGGVVNSLWFKGGGNPSLVSEELWEHVQHLKVLGIKEIREALVIDSSLFNGETYPGRQQNNERAYNAKPTAAPLNFNSVAFHILPDEKKNQTRIVAFPDIPYFKIRNTVQRKGTRTNIVIDQQSDDYSETWIFSGKISTEEKDKVYYRAVQNPTLFLGHALKALLVESGIAVSGSVKVGRVPAGVPLLVSKPSKPLSLIVRDMNKYSNNFIAESLVKFLGMKGKGIPGTTENGMQQVNQCLEELGIDKKGLQLENGSGLSYNNRVSAKHLMELLQSVHQDFSIEPEFLFSLSQYGTDGTLEDRKYRNNLVGAVRGKTGSLDGVSALAGFLATDSHQKATYVIIMNNMKAGLWESHKIQDAFLATLKAGRH